MHGRQKARKPLPLKKIPYPESCTIKHKTSVPNGGRTFLHIKSGAISSRRLSISKMHKNLPKTA
jgi:hypothetical protein